MAPALEEIVKLTKAGVAERVVIAFIQTSPTAYSLGAQDVIQLQQQGVSAQITTALMQRGDEVRQAVAESSKQTQAAAIATAANYQTQAQLNSGPSPTPFVYATTPVYPASTVSVTYFGSRSYACYPGYYGYNAGYYPGYYSYAPGYYGCYTPRAGFGIGGFHVGFGRCR